MLERHIEAVPVADFTKVVSAGGGGYNVGYRVAGFAAFVASALATLVVHPLDTVKTRVQVGVRGPQLMNGVYKGVLMNVLKEAPNAAIYLAVYEIFKEWLMGMSGVTFFRDLPLVTFMVAGALGDAVGSLVRVPTEIVNKRVQTGKNDNVKDAVTEIVSTGDGRSGMASAWQAVLMRDVPYGGLQIMLYEFGKVLLSAHPQWGGGVGGDVIVGALSGMVAAMVTTPMDVLVTRLSVKEGEGGVGTVSRSIWEEEGIGGFCRGMWQRGLYYAPMIGLFFALYEFNRGLLAHPEGVIAMAEHGRDAVVGIAMNEWRMLPGQLGALYSAFVPVMAGVVSLVEDTVPMAFGFVTEL